jgi:hypothetical protein
MKIKSILLASIFLALLTVTPAQAGVEITASKSLTVQPSGPRSGESGRKYFNIQGKENKQYASFGVLTFDIPEELKGKKVKSVRLTLVQSIPRFANDGAIRFFLAPDFDSTEDLKFDTNAIDGLGNRIMVFHVLGSGNFKKTETGKVESFSLTDGAAIREHIAKGGKLCLVIAPADAAVAATYFGVNDKPSSPKLTLEMP